MFSFTHASGVGSRPLASAENIILVECLFLQVNNSEKNRHQYFLNMDRTSYTVVQKDFYYGVNFTIFSTATLKREVEKNLFSFLSFSHVLPKLFEAAFQKDLT